MCKLRRGETGDGSIVELVERNVRCTGGISSGAVSNTAPAQSPEVEFGTVMGIALDPESILEPDPVILCMIQQPISVVRSVGRLGCQDECVLRGGVFWLPSNKQALKFSLLFRFVLFCLVWFLALRTTYYAYE